jgi:hypothetical protein
MPAISSPDCMAAVIQLKKIRLNLLHNPQSIG